MANSNAAATPDDLSRFERVSLLLLVLVPLGLNAFVTLLRIAPSWPMTPWEPALLTEGWRLAHGLPVYDDSHATHMYGPLFTVWLAGLQSLFGFNYPAIRLAFVLLGVASAVGLAVLTCPTVKSWRFLLAATLFLSCNVQTGLGFSHGWSDMPALLLAVAGLYVLLGRAGPFNASRGVFASALLLLAFLFKQTAGMAALIPVILWIFDPKRRGNGGLWLWLPVFTIFAAVACIAFFLPAMFHQMVRVPASISVFGARWWEGLVNILQGHVLFWLCAGLAIARPARIAYPRGWLVAGAAVIAISAWTFAKAGGYYNSLIPGFLMLSLASVVVINSIPTEEFRAWNMIAKIVAAVAFCITTMGGTLEIMRLLALSHGDENYGRVIEFARKLPGVVSSPEDPSIALQSKGSAGNSLFFELDNAVIAGKWPEGIPARIDHELRRSDWLIEVRSPYSTIISPASLEGAGWTKVAMPDVASQTYLLWKRTPPH
jgi:hypothetical protein